MSEPILDCHHNDVSGIVRMRALHRVARKVRNFLRYQRQYARRR